MGQGLKKKKKKRQLKIITSVWRKTILFLPQGLSLEPFLNSTMVFL